VTSVRVGHLPLLAPASRRALVRFLMRLFSVAIVLAFTATLAAQAGVSQTTAPMPGLDPSLKMITGLLDQGRGIEAEQVARALLARVESVRGRDVREIADVLDLLGRAVRRSSKVTHEEKSAFAERAVAIRERVLDPGHPDLATSLINLGVLRVIAGDPAAARPLLERALAIRQAAFGTDHLLVAGALQSLAGLLMTLHDDAGAKGLLERAQQIRERAYGADHADSIRTLVNLAILYQETGDYTGARLRFARARSLAEKIRGPSTLLTLHVLTGTAVVLSELAGDPAGAAALNERLLGLAAQFYGPADPRLRTSLENLAMDRRDLGDYAAAMTAAERSLAIAERAFGPDHAEVARTLHTLASVHAGLGDYSAAMRLFERATRINEEVLQTSNREQARASWFIPELLPLSGYGPDDADLFERVLATREKNRGLGDPRTAEGLSNLAAVLSSAEDYRRTRPLFERAFEAQERFLGPDHPEVGAAATNLAHVLSRTGDDDKARRLYERAVAIWEKSFGPDHPKVATGLTNLAGYYLRIGDDHQPGPLLDRALAIQEQVLGRDHPDVALTLSSRADLEARTGGTAEAFATAARAEAIGREHLRLTVRTLPERQALAYASSLPSNIGLMLQLASTRPGDSRMLAEAWDAVIRARGLVLDEVAARHRAASAGESSESAPLATALAVARQRLAALALHGVRNDPPDRYRHLLEQARAEKERTERALAEYSAQFRDDQSRTRVLLHDVSAALPADSALVAFFRYQEQQSDRGVHRTARRDSEPSYIALVLGAGDRRPALVPVGGAGQIESLILQWRKQLDQEATAAGRDEARGEAAYRRVAGALRRQVWDPLSAHLANAARVFVVPDGALHLVSFAALPTGASRYLVETGPVIHYLSAERDLVSPEAGPLGRGGLLALGDPAFEQPDVAVARAVSFRGTRSGCLDFRSMRFDRLPASLKEVDEVVALWNQARSDRPDGTQLPGAAASPDALRLTGSAASESAFKTQAAGRRILHVATHGFFLGAQCASALDPSEESSSATSARIIRENPLILSGLILAGANQRHMTGPDQEDGVLTAEEVAALDLNGVEWAVLSGCDTGVGEVRAGEGVFGLRRAFQTAGARTVIMTLWPVEDRATRLWMRTLYRARLTKQRNTADAVREAALAVLRERRTSGLSAHPFYWGAFVGAGDWR